MLSNQAILFLPLTLCTTIKSSSLIFTFLWGILFGTHSYKTDICFSVCAITAGLAIAIYYTDFSNKSPTSSTRFLDVVDNSTLISSPIVGVEEEEDSIGDLSGVGLLLSFGSAAASGLRWVMLQKLMSIEKSMEESEHLNSGSVNSSLNSVMTTLYRFTPYSVLTIVPFVFIFEAPHMMTEFAELAYNSQTNSSQIGGAATVLMMLVMGVINYNLPIMYHVFLLNC